MIVRRHADRLMLITQPDHAAMAGRVMEHCSLLSGHPRRPSILRACTEHDGGWIEIDANPRVDANTGDIIDFMTAPAAVKQTVWPRAIARLAGDPMAAALVAEHAITVYSRFAADPQWTTFFDEMRARRDALLRGAGYRASELEADYPFVRLADLISLTFCNGWTDAQSFAGWTVRGEGTHVTVTPQAFAGTIPFEVAARAIDVRGFPSDQALRDVLAAAPEITLTGTLS